MLTSSFHGQQFLRYLRVIGLSLSLILVLLCPESSLILHDVDTWCSVVESWRS